MTFLDQLITLDQSLFTKINTGMINPFFDVFMPFMRNARSWIPLYILILGFVYYKFGWKGWPWLLFVVLLITTSDQISSSFIKPMVGRLRPCNEPLLADTIRKVLGRCSGGYSFTSSHAFNHFSVGTYFYVTLKQYIPKLAPWFFVWAGLVSFAQIYVGVHYPGDILCGAIMGTLLGSFFSNLLLNKIGMPPVVSRIRK